MTTETLETLDIPRRERLKLAVRGLYDAQKLRIQLQLRIARLVRDEIMDEDEAKTFFHLPFGWFEKAEHEMEKLVKCESRDLPIVKKWLSRVRGIGPRLSGLLVANISDIERFDNVAKLWAYAGLHVIDGKAVKRKAGQKSNWNQELKTTAWKMGQSMIKSGGPYRNLYDKYKCRIIEREQTKGNTIYTQVKGKWVPIHEGQCTFESQAIHANPTDRETQKSLVNHEHCEDRSTPVNPESSESQSTSVTPNGAIKNPEWTLGRINNMAIRYIAKILLSHLWHVWREMEGLPTRVPYAVEYLGHTTVLDPWDFVEKKK